MTLSELRFVVAVAKEKNFRRAASKCFVSQPALSLAIKKLEDELNVSLFERNRTEVTITEIGEKIVAQANLILEEVEKIKSFAKSGGDPLDGLIKVGMIHSVGPYLLPQIIPILRKLAPKMPLEVERVWQQCWTPDDDSPRFGWATFPSAMNCRLRTGADKGNPTV